MREKTPEQLVKQIERRLWLRTGLPLLLCDVAISALMVTGRTGANIVYDEVHQADSLPHD